MQKINELRVVVLYDYENRPVSFGAVAAEFAFRYQDSGFWGLIGKCKAYGIIILRGEWVDGGRDRWLGGGSPQPFKACGFET